MVMLGKVFTFPPTRRFFRKGYGSNLYKVYLNIINPYVSNEEYGAGVNYEVCRKYDCNSALEIPKILQSMGYDGVYYNDWDKGMIIVAYSPNQIKSITNKTPTNSDNINEDTPIKKDPTSGVSPTQKYHNRMAKRTIRSIAKRLNDEQGIDCSFVIDAKSMTVHHIDDTKGEEGLKNNSFDNLWFICSDDSRDSEVIHKLLHYIERNDIEYDDLLKELNNIKIVKYDGATGKFIPKTLRDFKECCESFNKGLKEDMELNFDRALLDKWIDDLNAKGAKYHQTFSYTEGGKYIRVSYTYGGRYDTAVFAFVDADGNIYKPAGWKTPAKGVRARIDQNPPMDEKDLYSARYRAAVYGESVNGEKSSLESIFTKLFDRFNSNGRGAKLGKWRIANGGYDLDYVLYYDEYPVAEKMRGERPTMNNDYLEYNGLFNNEEVVAALCKCDRYCESLLVEKPSPDGYEPTKKGIAYKVFKVKNGKLYPPMVANAGGADTPIGVWLDAEEGEFAGLSKTGRPQVKSTGSGNLSYRPGWHLGDVPRAKQFDRLNKETGEYEFPKDFVWAECEYAMDVDYQPESDARGYERTKVDKDGNVITTKSDKYQHSLAGLPKLPTNGYYKYRTNPNPDTVPWVITGQMKVKRLLSDAEVNAILEKNGIEPIHRQGGDKTLAELGLKESVNEDFYNTGFDKIGLSQEEVNEFTHNLESAIQSNMGRMFKVNDVSLDGNTINVVVGAGKYEDDEPIYQSILPSKVKSDGIDSYIEPIVKKAIIKFADDNT